MAAYINNYLPRPLANAMDAAYPSVVSGAFTGLGSLLIKNVSFPAAVVAGALCHGVDKVLHKYIFPDFSRGLTRPLALVVSMGLMYSVSSFSALQILTIGSIYVVQNVALQIIDRVRADIDI